MLLDTIFAPFVKERPVCVMARASLERLLDAQRLDALFARTAERQYTRELLFSSLVQAVYLHPADKSSMKTCIFTPPHETGIIAAHIVPYARSHDTRLGRESSWRKAPSGTHFFQAADGQGVSLRSDR